MEACRINIRQPFKMISRATFRWGAERPLTLDMATSSPLHVLREPERLCPHRARVSLLGCGAFVERRPFRGAARAHARGPRPGFLFDEGSGEPLLPRPIRMGLRDARHVLAE